MSNFELIDDYLANRLNEQDKKAFEQQLEGDPALKEEVEFQQQVVQGVRNARAIELKNMLSNVPLGGSTWGGGKIAATAVTAGIIATCLYFYFKEKPLVVTSKEEQRQEIPKLPEDKLKEPVVPATNESTVKDSANIDKPIKEKSIATKETKASTPVRKPDIEVVDPSAELSSTEEKQIATPGRSEISASKMEVITGIADKKHNFHYQFVNGKLMLYGPFDKSLYEILEIHGDGHAVFLFYRENYYLLDEKQSKITVLRPISDGQLLKKLKEYRGQ